MMRKQGKWRLRAFLLEHKKILLFTVFLVYLYFRGIGDHGLLDPLEGVNASISLDMLATGRYLNPSMGEAACGGRAVGAWWLSAFAIRVLGWHESAVRFWPALCGLLTALATALSVKPAFRWLTAALAASTTLIFVVSQLAAPQALYACCMAFAMAAVLRALEDPETPWRWGMMASLLAGFLAYGLEGLLLPAAALSAFTLVTRRGGTLKALLPALVGALAGAVFWCLVLWAASPQLLTFLRCETPQFLRPTGPLALAFILGGLLPWPGFMFVALRDAVAQERKPGLFRVIWFGIFTLGAFLTGDLLALGACVPPLASLAGEALGEWLERGETRKVQWAVTLNLLILLPSVTLGLPLAVKLLPPLQGTLISLVPWALFLSVFTFATWHYAQSRQMAKLARNVSLVALFCLMPLAGVFDLLAERGSVHNVGFALRGAAQRGDAVLQYGVNHPSLYFYALTPYGTIDAPQLPGVTKREFTDADLHRIWDGRDGVFLLIPEKYQPQQPLPEDVYNIAQAEGMVLLSNRIRRSGTAARP